MSNHLEIQRHYCSECGQEVDAERQYIENTTSPNSSDWVLTNITCQVNALHAIQPTDPPPARGASF